MIQSHKNLFIESAEWIRSNPFATTHDVPERLMQTWICELDDAAAPTGFPLSLFTFGYCQRQLLVGGVAPEQKLRIGAEKLIELFQLWQLKLGLVEIHRKTELRVGAMPLFDFPRDEPIEYWLGARN